MRRRGDVSGVHGRDPVTPPCALANEAPLPCVSKKKTQDFSEIIFILSFPVPLHLLTYFTLGVNLTPAIKTSRNVLELILFPKFKCEVLYVCLLTTYIAL